MGILYSAIEDKQAELEESLLNIQHRREQIKNDFNSSANESQKHFTQDDKTYLLLEEISMQEQNIQEEFDILSSISNKDGEFEDVRLAARSAYTCILEGHSEISIIAEEEKLTTLADKSESNYQDLVIEYRRLKKAPPNGLSQNELLRLYIKKEHKIAAERVRNSLFNTMAENMLREHNVKKHENILSYSPSRIAI